MILRARQIKPRARGDGRILTLFFGKAAKFVWSSAFTRFRARGAADRLKAELQTRTVSRCAPWRRAHPDTVLTGNWKVPGTRRLKSLRYARSAPAFRRYLHFQADFASPGRNPNCFPYVLPFSLVCVITVKSDKL
jgi:hypothetical protein